MASKPLVIEARVATELLRGDTQTAAAELGNIGDAAEAVAQKLETALGKAGAKFGPWAEVAEGAMEKVRNSSAQVAKEIDKLAGSLASSGGDAGVAAALKAVDAQKAKLAAIEAVDAATRRNIGTERELTAAEQTYLAGLQEAKNSAGTRLAQLQAEAGALERLQIELGAVVPRSNEVVDAHSRMSTSSQMFMHSVRAGTDSFAAGLPTMMIFTEQLGRLAEASAYAASESGKTSGAMAVFGRVMGGPWGVAITAGISILATVAGHMDIFSDKIGEAEKKLLDQAEAERIADQASIRFGNTLEGLILREKKLGDELDRQIKSRREIAGLTLGKAEQDKTEAQGHLNDARRGVDTAQGGYNSAKARFDNALDPKERGLAATALANASARLEASRKVLADAQTADADADTNVRRAQVVGLQAKARAAVDPKEAARQRIDAQKDSLTYGFVHLRNRTPEQYEAEFAALQKEENDSKKTAKKGPSAATLAKRAEAARVKLVNQDEAYTDQERAARHRLLDATAKTTASEESRDALLREDINAEAVATKTKVADQLSAKKISAAQAEHLVDLAEQTRLQKLKNVDLQRDAQDVKDASAQDVAGLDRQLAMAQIENDLATTAKQRRAIQLRMLDLQEQRERALAQEVLANPLSSQAERDSATARLQSIDDQRPNKVAQIERSTATPLEAYKQHLQSSVGDINTSLQSIEVSGLNNLEDGFAGVVTNSQRADQAIKSMVTSTISQLAKLAVQKLAFSFFGLSSGGTIGGKATGGLLGFATGGLPGFAGGTRGANGMISGPGTGTSDSILALVNGKKPIMVSDQEGIVNAQAVRNYWPAIDAMNRGTFPRFASGGLLAPRMPSIMGMGSHSPMVLAPLQFDLRGAITTPQLMQQMVAISQQHATAALAAAPSMAEQQISDNAAQRIPT